MSKQEDFRQAAIDYADSPTRNIIEQVGYEMGCEYGYQYAIPKVCHIIRMIYIQNGDKLPSDFEDIVNRRMKML